MASNKLLLLEDVDGLGRKGDIVGARPGYTRNFLLPQGFAIIADKSALRMQERLQEERKQKAVVDKKESEELAAKVQEFTCTTIVKVDHDGHMYGSVTTLDIVHLLKDQANVTVEKREVQLQHPIKETGVYTIKLKLKEGVLSSFVLKVIPEEVPGGAPGHGAGAAEEKGSA